MTPRKGAGRSAKDLRRAQPSREPYDRVLIVCEGSKTEPAYLQAFVDALELSSANVVITGASDSSPLLVARHAKQLYDDDSRNGGEYDRVFCVFDRDSHSSYTDAIDLIKRAKPERTFESITSVPCFEYWVLLHFEFTTQAFESAGSKSPCDHVLARVRKHLPEYSKGNPELYKTIQMNTDLAIDNANRANQAGKAAETDNPSTKMGRLVKYLRSVKDPDPAIGRKR